MAKKHPVTRKKKPTRRVLVRDGEAIPSPSESSSARERVGESSNPGEGTPEPAGAWPEDPDERMIDTSTSQLAPDEEELPGVENPKSQMENSASGGIADLPQEFVEFDRVNPAPYNPRVDLQPGDPAYRELEREMLQFGFAGGMVWNRRTGNLVGGHQRVKILQAHGKTGALMAVCDLPLPGEKLFNLALNKAGGAWDHVQLRRLLDELLDDDEVDATLSGFDAESIEKIVNDGHRLIEQLVPPEAEEEEPSGGNEPLKDSYGVMVQCRDEGQQKRVFEHLQGFLGKSFGPDYRARGVDLRVMTL